MPSRSGLPAVLGFCVGFFLVMTAQPRGHAQAPNKMVQMVTATPTGVPEIAPTKSPRSSKLPKFPKASERESLFRPLLFYKNNVLEESVFNRLKTAALAEVGKAVVIGTDDLRRNYITDVNSTIAQIMQSSAVRDTVRTLTRDRHVVPAYNFPSEVRVYDEGVGLDWHRDTLLYRNRQYELVLVIANSGGAETVYRDRNNATHTIVAAENSLLVVRADGAAHMATAPKKGNRVIVKSVYIRDDQTTPEHRNFMLDHPAWQEACAVVYPSIKESKAADGSDLFKHVKPDRPFANGIGGSFIK